MRRGRHFTASAAVGWERNIHAAREKEGDEKGSRDKGRREGVAGWRATRTGREEGGEKESREKDGGEEGREKDGGEEGREKDGGEEGGEEEGGA
ncbi:hypothetical protein ACFY36_01840 [Actinoplanes sp. NPDC000266]